MNKLVGLALGISLMAGLILTSAGCTPGQNISQSNSTAANFIRDSATFKFDGIADSIRLVKMMETDGPNGGSWFYTVAFQTAHPGHGDRSGQMLAQMVTNHTAIIEVKDGKVAAAVCDGEWDIKADKMTDTRMQTMPAGQNVTGQGDMLAMQTMPAGENVTAPGTDLAAR